MSRTDPNAAMANPPSPAKIRRIVAASTIGNALEWFDFLVYGFFATTIAKEFFPTGNPRLSLMLAIGTFGISFITRPVGSLVLGTYADRHGRKAALTLSIRLMMLATLAVAIMPTYGQIGLLAPIAMLLARLVQGFAVGGEFGSATAFMMEHSKSRRGFYASWQFASQGVASVLAAGFGGSLSGLLTPADLAAWGWRLPFLFGLLIGPLGYYIRRHLDETPEFQAEQQAGATRDTSFTGHWLNLLLAIGIIAQSTVSVYVLQLYMPTYATSELGMPAAQSFAMVAITGGLQFLLSPVVGALSDRYGRLGIMLGASVATAVLIYPMFFMLRAHPTIGWLFLLQAASGILKAAYSGPMPALLAEIFPTRIRSTGLSLGYSLGVTLFGGLAPFIITWIIGVTGDKLAPSYYVLTAALLSGLSLIVVARRSSGRGGARRFDRPALDH